MQLLSYHGTRAGFMGLGNWLIRLRLRGRFSHSEILFEPGDGVDDLMPDGTTAPDADGATWCASSTGLEPVSAWSGRRAGHRGGVRLKRIVVDPAKWTRTPLPAAAARRAAQWARTHEGQLYDWQLIFGFIAWLVPNKASRVMCSEACAEMLGFEEAWRYDPCVLHSAVRQTIQPASAGFSLPERSPTHGV